MKALFLYNQRSIFISTIGILSVLMFFTAPIYGQEPAQDILANSTSIPSPMHISDIGYRLPTEHLSVLSINLNGKQIEVPAIKYSARQAIVKGVTIIISEIQAQGQVDASLHHLAKTLPDWGWHTMLITPAQAYVTSEVIELTDTASNKQSNESADEDAKQAELNGNTSVDESQTMLPEQVEIKSNILQAPFLPYTHKDYVSFLKALTKALNTRFSQQPGYKIIYANGKSASGLLALFNKPGSVDVDALVLGNTYWPSADINGLLPDQLASLPMPILDLVSMSDNHWAKQTAKHRVIAAKVNLKPMYRQREIMEGSLSINHHSALAKQLVSWTHFLGW